jgi:DNA-binding NtrC family response regulator
VRELRNLLEQAVLPARGSVLDAEDLGLRAEPPEPVERSADTVPGVLSSRTLPEMEREALAHVLARAGWNVSRAARELGIGRETLRYRIDKHGLATAMPPDFRQTR